MGKHRQAIYITQVELTQPIPDLRIPETRYTRARAFIRLAAHPIGIVEAKVANGCVPAEELRDLIWREHHHAINVHLIQQGLEPVEQVPVAGLRKGPQGHACVSQDLPDVTVIVCTRDRVQRLKTSIDSLIALDYPMYEIIVVDNAPPDDATYRCITDNYAHLPFVKYVLEPRKGLSRARNCGLAHARGAVVAFTDDDVIADPYWLRGIAEAFAKGEHIACVTGLTLPAELETEWQVCFEKFGGFNKGRGMTMQLFDMAANKPDEPLFPYLASRFGAGVNMAFRKGTLVKIGGFDEALGVGTHSQGSEDIDAFFRVIMAGQTLAVAPCAIVHHFHRRELQELKKQLRGSGTGFTAYLTKTILHNPLHLLRLLVRLPSAIRYLTNPESVRNESKDETYPVELTRAELLGMLAGPVAYLRSRF